MTKTLKSQIKETIKYYSLGDKKGNRTDLAWEDCANALHSLYEQFCLGVIGEDEYQGDDTPKIRSGDIDAGIRNQLRKEQRKKLKEVGK